MGPLSWWGTVQVMKQRMVEMTGNKNQSTSSKELLQQIYSIYSFTLVHTLSLPLTLLTSFFYYSCPESNRHGSGVSVVFTQNSITTVDLSTCFARRHSSSNHTHDAFDDE